MRRKFLIIFFIISISGNAQSYFAGHYEDLSFYEVRTDGTFEFTPYLPCGTQIPVITKGTWQKLNDSTIVFYSDKNDTSYWTMLSETRFGWGNHPDTINFGTDTKPRQIIDYRSSLTRFSEYYPNGKIRWSLDQNWRRKIDGQDYSGPITFYYESGETSVRGKIKNGKRHGKWTYYHPDGRKVRREKYRNGKMISFEQLLIMDI